MRVDKAKAIELRQQGRQYKDIASSLGCSVGWCKLHLKGIPIPSPSKAVAALAARPQGVTDLEISRIARGKDITNLKKVAKRFDPAGIYRPAWMSLSAPVDSYQSLLAEANALHERILEAVDSYILEYPDTDREAVTRELTKLASPWLVPEGLETHCQRNIEIALQLPESLNRP